jgi:hypothetical protein
MKGMGCAGCGKWLSRPQVSKKHPSGAKALLILWTLSARLKSCPFKTEASIEFSRSLFNHRGNARFVSADFEKHQIDSNNRDKAQALPALPLKNHFIRHCQLPHRQHPLLIALSKQRATLGLAWRLPSG